MRLRYPVAAALVVAGAASAKPMYVLYELSWNDLGNGNGVLEPPEAPQIVVRATVYPPVGTQVTYAPPPGTGVGTVAGLGSAWFDVVGECAPVHGQWTLSGPGFVGTTGTTFGRRTGWALGGVGTPQADGAVRDAQAAQLPAPGTTANATNPVAEIWRGRWSPSSYAVGVRFFNLAPPAASGGTHSSILVRYGSDPGGNPLYVAVLVPSFYRGVAIPIGQGGPSPCLCYANCDRTPSSPILNINDFICFQTRFAAGDPYADCDQNGSQNVLDFVCFQQRFAAGCP